MTDAVTISLIGAFFSTVSTVMVAFISRKQNILHKQIDGKMDELIKANKVINVAAGEEIGRAKLLDEQDPNSDTPPRS